MTRATSKRTSRRGAALGSDPFLGIDVEKAKVPTNGQRPAPSPAPTDRAPNDGAVDAAPGWADLDAARGATRGDEAAHPDDLAADPFGYEPAAAARLYRVLDVAYRAYFRCQTIGMEHLPASGRVLLAANHSGTFPFDGAMLMAAVRRATNGTRVARPLGDDFAFRVPSVANWLRRIGVVRANPENATRLLSREELVVVFPEGTTGLGKTFFERYRLQRFGRGGFVRIAIQTGTPVIPVAIVGAEEAQPLLAHVPWLANAMGVPYFPITPTFPWLGPLGFVPLPTKIIIAFGEPMVFTGEPTDDRVAAQAERVRSRVQEMVDELLARRRSILFG